jgi:hypothetical protein
MWVGLNAGGWGPSQYADVAGAVSYVRLDSGSEKGCYTPGWEGAAVTVALCDMAGEYNGGGVKALNVEKVVGNAVGLVKANPKILALEVLNEPGNRAFWGSEAESSENAAAYARILKRVHEAFVADFGSAAPLILASYDGGNGLRNWYEKMLATDPNVGSYIDGITIHSYSGTGPLGNRERTEEAHARTGMSVYITEFGWDSSQVTEAEQATDIYNFVMWARGQGYIAAVMDFGYRDYTNNAPDMWGVETHEGRKKPSYTALHEAALGQGLSF